MLHFEKAILLVVAVTMTTPSYATAADPETGRAVSPSTPEEAARQSLQALQDDRLARFAELLHPEALTRFRASMMEVIEAAAASGNTEEVLELFDRIKTVKHLQQLTDAQFLESYYVGVGKIRSGPQQLLREAKIEVLGQVEEGPDLAHVIYRLTVPREEDAPLQKLSVMSLKRVKDGWRTLLSEDVERVVERLKQRFGDKD